MARLDVQGLTRRPFFGSRDLRVERGEIVALRGPSGSGKTLFLRTVADLDPAEGGDVRLDGVSRAQIAPSAWRAAVLYVHQAGVRLPGTVRENVERILALARNGRIAPEGALDVPGLDAGADALRLSGGEAQALALHRALLLHPRVLLLDESTSAMDPARADYWERRVREAAEAGAAVLWVAHDERIADRLGARRESFP